MKKMAIVTRRMIMGGIEKALISMLHSIPKNQYDITVFVMGTGGELISEIPKHVKVRCVYGHEKTTIEKICRDLRSVKITDAIRTTWYSSLAKKAKTVYEQELYHSKMLPTIETEYDLAIAYHVPASFPVVYVMNNIKAKRKVAWIHSDVSQYEKELQPYRLYYEKYDAIFCVSKYAKEKFDAMFPSLIQKTHVFYNILDNDQLFTLAKHGEGFNDNFNGIRILTVGRLTSQKGQDLIPSILKRLISEEYQIRWYCIGDGESRQEIETLIKIYRLEEHLVLLGTKNNPYPYFKDCDIYVQPSRHEGYCITLAEARSFNKPIITTDFVGAREQINNEKNGLIVNFDQDEIYGAIKNLINNNTLCVKFQRNLEQKNISNESEINRLLHLV